MFQKDLKSKFEKIFGFKKTTFDEAGESEQNVLFIEITDCVSRVQNGKVYAKVNGEIVVYSHLKDLPFGFFNKRIQGADKTLTKGLFFFDIDTNVEKSPTLSQNLSERRVKFLFLYEEQYDPNQGEITSLNFGG